MNTRIIRHINQALLGGFILGEFIWVAGLRGASYSTSLCLLIIWAIMTALFLHHRNISRELIGPVIVLIVDIILIQFTVMVMFFSLWSPHEQAIILGNEKRVDEFFILGSMLAALFHAFYRQKMILQAPPNLPRDALTAMEQQSK